MAGRYKPYPEYTDSGSEWLEVMPAHWSATKIGFLSHKTGSGKTPKGGSEVYLNSGVLFLRSQNIYDTGLRLDDELVFISEETDAEMAGSRVQSGDILLNITGASIGRTCIVPEGFQKANVNQHVCIIRVPVTLQRFLALYLKSATAKAQIDSAQSGAAREGLNFEQLSNIVIFMPKREIERELIANFLDHETAKIDILIEKQQLLIQLLKEKRQAVISHAVTKGCNPNAKMRDSGVEWLGIVPEGWLVTRAKFLFDFVTSGSRGWADFYSDEGSLFFRITNLTRDTIEPKMESTQNVTPPLGSEGERSKIYKNDLLISITADLGSVCVANDEVAGGYVSQHVALCRPNVNVASSRWLGYFILSDIAKEQFIGSAYGGTKIQLSLEDIRELWIVQPTDEDQVEIALYIDRQLAKFSKIISLAEGQIALLQERRIALISAAVTGKIDVRDWSAPREILTNKEVVA